MLHPLHLQLSSDQNVMDDMTHAGFRNTFCVINLLQFQLVVCQYEIENFFTFSSVVAAFGTLARGSSKTSWKEA